MVNFLIAGIQRSGTTYIRRCLDSHSMIRCYGEVFLKGYRHPCGYYSYLSASLQRRVGHALYRNAVVNSYLDYLSSVSNEPFTGFKLMRSQVRQVPYRFPMLLSKIKRGDLKVIQIVRHNVLKTYLSRLSTQVSGRYHTRSDVDVAQLMVDTSRLVSELDKIRAENEWWQVMLSGTGFITVKYENFVANKETESRRILDYIGVDRYEELSSANRKINPDDISQLVLNYPELEAVLRKTRYEYCLQSDQ
jgi:LPS sulfotransferase NodH